MKKIACIILMLVLVICSQSVFAKVVIDPNAKDSEEVGAGSEDVETNDSNSNTGSNITVTDPGYNDSFIAESKLNQLFKDVWATLATLVQILSVGCVVFAGIRYMYASADRKADIKQGLINLAIGAILVFGAVTIVKAAASATNQILNTNPSAENVVETGEI